MRNDPIFGESVYLFRQSDLSPKTLAPILKNLLEDEVLRHTLGANIKHFDMSHAANSLAHVVTHEGELELS
jgi:UDP-N-acetylglucosamine:LPS N-acetylglucosamine transferase